MSNASVQSASTSVLRLVSNDAVDENTASMIELLQEHLRARATGRTPFTRRRLGVGRRWSNRNAVVVLSRRLGISHWQADGARSRPDVRARRRSLAEFLPPAVTHSAVG